MEKKNYFKLFFVICLSFILLFSGISIFSANRSPRIVNADVLSEEIDNSITGIPDYNLYQFLLNKTHSEQLTNINCVYYNLPPLTKLRTDCLAHYEGAIDFSGLEIQSINGLELLDLKKVISIDLHDNQITVYNGEFNSMSALKNVDLSHNQISTISNFQAPSLLETWNFNSNKISAIDLRQCLSGTIDLKDNQITSWNNIDFSAINSITTIVNLHLNYLTEAKPTNYYTLNMGLQGIKPNDKLTLGKIITYNTYSSKSYVTITKKPDVETYNLTDGQSKSNLTVGNYMLQFSTDGVIDDYVTAFDFTVIPTSPVYELYVENEKINDFLREYSKPVNVNLIGSENSIIKYKINDGETVTSDLVELKTSGIYYITFWEEIDGFKSEIQNIRINVSILNPMDFVWIILSIVAFVILFYVALFFYKKVGISKPNSNTKEADFK